MNKNIKRIISCILILAILSAFLDIEEFALLKKHSLNVYADDMNDDLYYKVVSEDEVIVSDTAYGVKNVVIPQYIEKNGYRYKVIGIGESAFNGETSLESVEIPNGVTTIGSNAFNYCISLKSIILPDSVKEIGIHAFGYCYNLESIKLSNNLECISNSMFSSCQNLREIVIPNSVKSIGNSAFKWCYSLISIDIPESVTSIGERAFEQCRRLIRIKIPRNVVNIGDCAFPANTTIVGYKDSVAYNYMNHNGQNKFLDIEKNEDTFLKVSGDFMYVEFESAYDDIPKGESVVCIVASIVDYPKKLIIPEIIEGKRVVSLGNYALWGCGEMNEVILPDSMIDICTGAFAGCDNIKEIKFKSGLRVIGQIAFSNSENLRHVEFSEGIEEISHNAFNDCDNLTEIKFPKTLKIIGEKAFYGCDNLSKIYFEGQPPTMGTYAIPNNSSVCAYYNPYNGDWSNIISKYSNVNWIPYDGKNIIDIQMYSIKPINNLKVGDTGEVLVSMYINGKLAEEQGDFSFVINDTSIVDYDSTKVVDEGTIITIKAKKKGSAILTITDNKSGKKSYASITVENNCVNLSADNMPIQYDCGTKYNAYVSGMYIDNFTKKNKYNNEYQITMDVYNSMFCYGSVDVYDNNHNLIYSERIDKHEGGNITSIGDTIFSAGNLISDIWNNGILSYKNRHYTTKTTLTLDVPFGGYIEIGNNIDKLDSCSIYNNCDLLAFAVLKYLSLHDDSSSENVRNTLTWELIRKLENGTAKKRFVEKIQVELLKELTIGNAMDTMKRLTKSAYDVLGEFDIDLDELLKECLVDAGLSVTEEALMGLMGFAGESLDACFNGAEYINVATQMIQMIQCKNSNVIRIDTYSKDNQLTDNGIKVDNSEDYEYVLRAFEVVDGKDFDKATESLNDVAKQFTLYNIYMLKNDVETQPKENVKVSIPIPKGYSTKDIHVYRIEEDGTKTDMNALIEGDYLIFTTNHFSLYAIVDESIFLGDVNGDGEIDIKDSALIKRYLAGVDVELDLKAADVNGDGEVTIKDSALIKRKLAGWE